jgi:hypothetical protein
MVRTSCRSVSGFRDGRTHLWQDVLGVRRTVNNPNHLKGDSRDTVESLLDRQNTMLAGHPFDADFTLVHTGSVLLDISFVSIVLI